MSAEIFAHLEFLYGADVAREIEPKFHELIAYRAARIGQSSTPSPQLDLSPADALLITYGDQVSEPGIAPLHTLSEFLSRHVSDLLSGVHILPFYPYSSDDGFSVKDFYAVDPALGSWEDVAQLRKKFTLMFDAVFNHVSAQGEWFQRFLKDEAPYHDYFVTVEGHPDLSQVVRPRALPLLTTFSTATGERKVWTTFSADQVDLDARNPALLLVLIDVLLFYVEHGARFIRLDAIAYLWKELGTKCIHLPQTHRIIELFRTVLDRVAPGVMLITETNVPHLDNISYFGNGKNEAQLVYNFALPPLVLHSLTTGNAEKLTGWAQSLVLPSERTAFFNFLASHDGIGVNPARGILSDDEIYDLVQLVTRHGGYVSYKHNADGSQSPYELNINYFDALSDPAANESDALRIQRFLVAQACMLALAGLPGIYFHSLFGSRNDRAGAEQSGIPRRINRQKFTRDFLETELNNSSTLRAQVFAGYSRLLRARRAEPAFHPCASQNILALDPRVFSVLRTSLDGQSRVLCLHNVSHEVVALDWHKIANDGSITNQSACDLLTNERGRLPDHLTAYAIYWSRLD